jgi:four helix bundle protein
LIGELTAQSTTGRIGMVTPDAALVPTIPGMQDTKNLLVAEHARRLAVAMYRLTAEFPSEERFGLAQQMRRAAVSIGSNIAEGCGRRGNRELLNHLYIALASAKELAFQLQLADDLGFGAPAARAEVQRELDRLERMLNRLTAYLGAHPARRRKRGTSTMEGPPAVQLTNQPTN